MTDKERIEALELALVGALEICFSEGQGDQKWYDLVSHRPEYPVWMR